MEAELWGHKIMYAKLWGFSYGRYTLWTLSIPFHNICYGDLLIMGTNIMGAESISSTEL